MAEIPLPSPSSLSPMKPSKARTAATQSSLAQERENLLLDLDETVPEIDRSFFETHLLPPSPLPSGVTTESIVANLIASGHAKVEEGWKRWRQPSDSTASEDKFFGKFEFLAEDILSACRNVPLVKTTRFLCNPKAKPESSSRENTSKPDAYALRNPVESSVTTSLRWVDVAVPAEFKKTNHRADREDVGQTLLAYLHSTHIRHTIESRESPVVYESHDARGCPSPICHWLHYRGLEHALLVLQSIRRFHVDVFRYAQSKRCIPFSQFPIF